MAADVAPAPAILPLILTECLKRIPDLVYSHLFSYGRTGDRYRPMRADRRGSHTKVLSCAVRSSSLQHDGLLCHIEENWARPMMASEIAAYCHMSVRTVYRCMEDLKDLGLIECQQIKRKNPVSGLIEVSIGIRRLTAKFWAAVGLTELFKVSCEWAKKRAKRRLFMPFKVVKQKVKKASVAVKDLAQSFLKGLAADELRVQKNFSDILKALRQRK